MPRNIWFRSYDEDDASAHSVATEEELLEFANMVRKAGGADPIPALLPANPYEGDSCLIALAVNFDSEVNGLGDVWYIATSDRTINTRIEAAIGLGFTDKNGYCVRLPEHIKNAAIAFDKGAAFTEYNKAYASYNQIGA